MAELLEFSWLKNVSLVDELSADRQLNIGANIAAFTKQTTF